MKRKKYNKVTPIKTKTENGNGSHKIEQIAAQMLPSTEIDIVSFPIGHKMPLDEERKVDLDKTAKAIYELESALGRARAIYLAAEQDYLVKRNKLESERFNVIKQAAVNLGIPVNSDNQRWEYSTDMFIFERKE